MNENIDLTQILKDCPKGTKFYSTIDGEVEFVEINHDAGLLYFTDHCVSLVYLKTGRVRKNKGECVLLPSKDQRDWSKFVPTWEIKKEIVKVTLHPFDKVLARDVSDGIWHACFVEGGFKQVGCYNWRYVIPYNKDTAHLLGTTDEPEVEYEIEFSKEFKE